MKETINKCRAKRIKKINNLSISLLALPATGQEASVENSQESSFYTLMQKAHHHARPSVEKRNRRQLALVCRVFLLVLSNLCASFLLTIVLLLIFIYHATAAATMRSSNALQEDGIQLYAQNSLCVSYTNDEVPQEWKDTGVCDATSGQGFARPGNGSCQQGWLKEMTETGQQECILTVVSVRGECPVGFALDSGRCDYEPLGRIGWQVGLCQAFPSGEVPAEWINNHVCGIKPVPDPEQAFARPARDRPCQPNWIKTMTRTAQQKCVLVE